MPNPCVDPLFRYEASVLLLPQVGRRISEALAFARCVPVEYRCSLVDFFCSSFLLVFFLMLFEPGFPHLFEPRHELFLVISEFCLLRFELFHSLINCPGTLEVPTRSIPCSKTSALELFAISLSAFRTSFNIGLRVYFCHMVGIDHGCVRIVTWVNSMTKVFEIVELLMELRGVNEDLLHNTI